MKNKKTIFIAFIVLVVFASSIAAQILMKEKKDMPRDTTGYSPVSFSRLSPKELFNKSTGGIYDYGAISKQNVLFQDLGTWQTFWKQHNHDSVKAIDFEKFTVAGVFAGGKTSGGYRIEIKMIMYNPTHNHTLIYYKESAPSGAAAAVITSPGDAVMFEKKSGTVEFILEE